MAFNKKSLKNLNGQAKKGEQRALKAEEDRRSVRLVLFVHPATNKILEDTANGKRVNVHARDVLEETLWKMEKTNK